MNRDARSGIILINVLVVLALAATVVFAMLSLGEMSLLRSQRFSEAGAAIALLQAGEQSAIAALRRDMEVAPEVDHASEPWAKVGQAPVAVVGGAFSLEIRDAQDRFNLNRLTDGEPYDSQLLRAVVALAELPPETAEIILAAMDSAQPVETPEELVGRAGLTPDEVAALAPFVTALPGPADINVNAASEEMLEAVFGNGIQARLLVALRDGQGPLTADDLETARVIAPQGVGFRSGLFRLRVTARSGGTVQSAVSLLQRRERSGGAPEVVVIRRRAAPAGPSPTPPSIAGFAMGGAGE